MRGAPVPSGLLVPLRAPSAPHLANGLLVFWALGVS